MMNQLNNVQKFAAGGMVRKFQTGGGNGVPAGSSAFGPVELGSASIASLDNASLSIQSAADSLSGLGIDMGNLAISVTAFGDSFKASVEKLAGINVGITLAPTTVTVNLSGGALLQAMTDSVRDQIFTEVTAALENGSFDNNGNFVLNDIG
jgi:hypothetical protein